jgi:hypothetical protein
MTKEEKKKIREGRETPPLASHASVVSKIIKSNDKIIAVVRVYMYVMHNDEITVQYKVFLGFFSRTQ